MKEKIVYMDTNVLNDIAYLVNKDFVFKRMKDCGYVLAISEVNVLEILRDRSDLYNIDQIITMLQELYELDGVILLPGIYQVIHNYLTKEENYEFPKDNVIYDVLNDRDKEFIIDEENERKLNDLKEVYKKINKMIDIIKNKEDCNKCNFNYCTNNINEMSKVLSILFLVYEFQLIIPFQLDEFWNKLEINGDEEKIKYINDNKNFIVENENSPFRTMGKFALLQKERNNGTFNDCLHSCYFQFANLIVSKDKHFLNNVCKCISYEEFMNTIGIKIIHEDN